MAYDAKLYPLGKPKNPCAPPVPVLAPLYGQAALDAYEEDWAARHHQAMAAAGYCCDGCGELVEVADDDDPESYAIAKEEFVLACRDDNWRAAIEDELGVDLSYLAS